MATVQVTFKRAAVTGVPVEAIGFSSNETFTSSGTSQATAAAASNGEIAVINTDGSIRITSGTAPTAVADDTCERFDAGRWQVSVPQGHKIAIIDA